jgi:hypothetical protein
MVAGYEIDQYETIRTPSPLRARLGISFAVFALSVVLAPAALAQHQTFVVNPEGSQVNR